MSHQNPSDSAEGVEKILGPDDSFQFSCDNGLDCFTNCCRDVTIFLTPYDVVTEEGCQVYENRPWACRMFPLDLADEGGYRLAVSQSRCHGFGQGEPTRVRHYLTSQDTQPFQEAEKAYTEITRDPKLASLDVNNPQIFNMVLMATYHLDAFEKRVFSPTFLERFQVEPERLDAAKNDNEALLKLGLDWLAFGLLGRMNFQIYEAAAQAVESKPDAPGTPGAQGDPGDSSGSPAAASDPKDRN